MPNDLTPGLAPGEAAERLRRDGPNELGTSRRRTLPDIVGEVVREPMFLLLLGAGGIYAVMGDTREALVLLGFVLVIMAVTVLQERRTDRALDALRDLSSPRALALRGGTAVRIPGREVVRGDVLLLAEGDRIPADGVLLQAHELATDESMLTGESEAVPKPAGGERVFAGTLVVSGQGAMRVEATGRHTELGRIGASLQDIGLQASPLRDDVARLTRRLLVVGLALCALLVALFRLSRGGWLEALLAGITLAMGVLPQEFPVVMIVFLALAARRLAAQRVLTRRLGAIETLGQTTVLAVDKTGTLTLNRMAVATLSAGGEALDVRDLPDAALPQRFHELLEYAVLASETEPHDPMEQAFHRLGATQLAHTGRLHPSWTLAREYELAPELLAMSHLWREHGGRHDTVASKGAPEAIAELCHLDAAALSAVMAQAAALADQGLRVLAVAKARHPVQQAWPAAQHDFDFEWLGLVALADPLRPEVPQAVATCRGAGIRVLMITGDHPRTARAIARQAGLDAARVVTGQELAALDATGLARLAGEASVFARMRPQQKLALVEALKSRGEVVAMTGDGVNDAPALKAAHIGIAMGQRGTDVAREAASLVLLQDDFASIVTAIRRGRQTYTNLRRALTYTVAVHVPIVGLALLPVMLGLPVVLAPMHIAFLELVIDPACSLVFEAEDSDGDLMRQPPRRRAESLLPRASVLQSLLQGAMATALVMGLYAGMLSSAALAPLAPATAFTALVAANAALILPSRAGGRGWSRLFTGMTRVSRLVVTLTFAALAIATGVPAVAALFGFTALPPWLWLGCAVAGLLMAVPFELARRWLSPGSRGGAEAEPA
ncbi:cation-translocating P-type ATPase [Azohydromonas australica]|uniref:cation-translocating P-type ATPase n=1 Tax=Azohydromonas australica TaxID=364039 RepID=UPI00041B2D87|nr:cation-translocating P-type ATPase [Azohydromonas australica]